MTADDADADVDDADAANDTAEDESDADVDDDESDADGAESRPPALIAGVGETLGAALAGEFASERPVALLARTEDTVDALAADLRDDGHDAVAVTGDVTGAESVAAAASAVRERFGPVGVVVHNASALGGGTVDDCTPETFEATWRVRAKGGFHLASEFVDDLRETGGTLLFSGTNYATEPAGTLADWDSAAAATRGLSRSLARDLEPDGVHVAYVALAGTVVPDDAHLVDGRMPASRVAKTFREVAGQERGAWTSELALEPARFDAE